MTGKAIRRAKGAGSIRQRTQGSWQVRYDGPPDTNGKTTKLTETVRGSRRDAERALRERLGVVESGAFVRKTRETVAEFLREWMDTYVATNTKPSTQRGYQGVFRRYVVPALGTIPLQNLLAQHIQKMYAAMLERSLSAQTVVHTHRVLREALGHAVKWGVLARNPSDATTSPRPVKKELKMWGVETIHRFLEAADSGPYRDIYHLAVLTGMRRSELLGLMWDNLDLSGGQLAVTTTLQRINGKELVLDQPKTPGSRRSIALGDTAVALLRNTKTRQLERRLAAGPAWQENGYVFSQADGKPLHPDKVSNHFRIIVRKAGLPHLTLHGLRHAHATLMLAAGVHSKIVSERLGHANISVTMDIYRHVMQGMQEAAAKTLDDRLAGHGSG